MLGQQDQRKRNGRLERVQSPVPVPDQGESQVNLQQVQLRLNLKERLQQLAGGTGGDSLRSQLLCTEVREWHLGNE